MRRKINAILLSCFVWYVDSFALPPVGSTLGGLGFSSSRLGIRQSWHTGQIQIENGKLARGPQHIQCLPENGQDDATEKASQSRSIVDLLDQPTGDMFLEIRRILCTPRISLPTFLASTLIVSVLLSGSLLFSFLTSSDIRMIETGSASDSSTKNTLLFGEVLRDLEEGAYVLPLQRLVVCPHMMLFIVLNGANICRVCRKGRCRKTLPDSPRGHGVFGKCSVMYKLVLSRSGDSDIAIHCTPLS